MELLALDVDRRTDLGKSSSRRIRRDGAIPGVIYAKGSEAIPLLVDGHHYEMTVDRGNLSRLYKLKSSDKKLNGLMALVKAMQLDPIKDKVVHVDFLEVTEGQKIQVTVPVVLVGESQAVKQEGAIMNQTAYELDIECLPREIPESVSLDISDLLEGHSLQAADLLLPDNVTLKSDSAMPIVSLIREKVVEEEVVPAEEEEAVEGEEGAPAAEGEEAVAEGKEGKEEK